MGFIKAFSGSIGGVFADQWLDYFEPMPHSKTEVIFPAVKKGTNAGRGSNTKGSDNIISNGSKIIVPPNTALVTVQDGRITGCIAEEGGFEYRVDGSASQSIFAGDGIVKSLISQAWDRFKFGGIPSTQQSAFYVYIGEVDNNTFGTQDPIFWDDAFLGSQAGAMVRGSYTLHIQEPMTFILRSGYLQSSNPLFDLQDFDDPFVKTLFDNVLASLTPAFSKFFDDPSKPSTMKTLQSNQLEFTKVLKEAIEENYGWLSNYGIEIGKVNITAIAYNEETAKNYYNAQAMDASILRAEKAGGADAFAKIATSLGVQSAGNNAESFSYMGGINNVTNAGQQPQQSQQQPQSQPQSEAQPQEDPYEKLRKLKGLLDEGIITQEEFDEQKKKLLGV